MALPKDYLKDGYFDETGNIYTKLISGTASEIADTFKNKYGNFDIKYTQMRKFFQHARQAQRTYESVSYEERKEEKTIIELKNKIVKLKSMVLYAQGRAQVPESFADFITKNVLIIEKSSIEDIPNNVIKGFIPHFEAVVAYFKYKSN